MANGKYKGSEFEREMCKTLSSWLSAGKRLDYFWRSAMSGGRATVAMKKNIELGASSGDITAICSEGEVLTKQFMIECKAYRSLQLDQLIFTDTGEFRWIWLKLKADSKKYHREPMLIAKQNQRPVIVGLGRQGRLILDPKWKLKQLAWFTTDDIQLFRLSDVISLSPDYVIPALTRQIERGAE